MASSRKDFWRIKFISLKIKEQMKNINQKNFFIFIVIISILFIAVLFNWQQFFPSAKYLAHHDQSAVIKEIQTLGRLETTQFTMEKVIDLETGGNSFEQFLFGDRILLIAYGQVIAGVDLSRVTTEQVQVEGNQLILNLPKTEIFVSDLNEDKTRVYDRQKGLLTKGDTQLESAARQEAEKVIRNAACEGDILTIAAENAQKQLETLFKSVGFEKVEVKIAAGDC